MKKDIQLYSLATPNVQKVSVALEEMGLPYTPHTVNIGKGEQFKPRPKTAAGMKVCQL